MIHKERYGIDFYKMDCWHIGFMIGDVGFNLYLFRWALFIGIIN